MSCHPGPHSPGTLPAQSGIPSNDTKVQADFYVAPAASGGSDDNPGTIAWPFLTLEKAKHAVRSINANMTGDIVVNVRAGLYELEAPFILESLDSGNNGYNVVYQAYGGEPAIISGGQVIGGWSALEKGLYRTDAKGLRFRQLYANGRPAIRARTPNAGHFYKLRSWDESERTIILNSSDIMPVSGLNDVEIIIHKEWTQNNLRIGSLEVRGPETHVVPLEPDRTKAFSSADFLRIKDQSFY
ncbi:MAG: hypothetical protein ACREJU_17445, partial [Nitrospiraceae bacterium]